MNNIAEYSAIVVIVLFLIKEMFGFLKAKKTNGNGNNTKILLELQKMNQNHLEGIKTAINNSNRELIDAIRDDNMKIIELLGRIEGKLSK